MTTRLPIGASDGYAITPSDTVALAAPEGSSYLDCKGIYIGGTTGGDITVKFKEGDAVVKFDATAQGRVLPIAPKYVMSTGTTATEMVALY